MGQHHHQEEEALKVDGVDYSPEGIEELRQKLIGFRDSSMSQWPEAIPFTVCMTHTVALLHYLIKLMEEVEKHER